MSWPHPKKKRLMQAMEDQIKKKIDESISGGITDPHCQTKSVTKMLPRSPAPGSILSSLAGIRVKKDLLDPVQLTITTRSQDDFKVFSPPDDDEDDPEEDTLSVGKETGPGDGSATRDKDEIPKIKEEPEEVSTTSMPQPSLPKGFNYKMQPQPGLPPTQPMLFGSSCRPLPYTLEPAAGLRILMQIPQDVPDLHLRDDPDEDTLSVGKETGPGTRDNEDGRPAGCFPSLSIKEEPADNATTSVPQPLLSEGFASDRPEPVGVQPSQQPLLPPLHMLRFENLDPSLQFMWMAAAASRAKMQQRITTDTPALQIVAAHHASHQVASFCESPTSWQQELLSRMPGPFSNNIVIHPASFPQNSILQRSAIHASINSNNIVFHPTSFPPNSPTQHSAIRVPITRDQHQQRPSDSLSLVDRGSKRKLSPDSAGRDENQRGSRGPVSQENRAKKRKLSSDSARDSDAPPTPTPKKPLSRDEKIALNLGIPPNVLSDIVVMPMDEFNDFCSKREYAEDTVVQLRDIRRRGKNKVAAQNCRKRKEIQIVDLQKQNEEEDTRKAVLKSEKDRLMGQIPELWKALKQLVGEDGFEDLGYVCVKKCRKLTIVCFEELHLDLPDLPALQGGDHGDAFPRFNPRGAL